MGSSKEQGKATQEFRRELGQNETIVKHTGRKRVTGAMQEPWTIRCWVDVDEDSDSDLSNTKSRVEKVE